MKDYKLSELKAICKALSAGHNRQCEICPIRVSICSFLEVAPSEWNIDKKDGEEE